jgi:ABC-type sulfate/molybdate transport systems ATPase subunit
MGPSGSGKSTMMNIIGCLDRLTDGRYLLDASDVSTLSMDQLADIRNQKIGFVFQSFQSDFPHIGPRQRHPADGFTPACRSPNASDAPVKRSPASD